MSLCEECAEEVSVSKCMPKEYKICKTCGRLFIPSEENPNRCICQKCHEEEPQPDKRNAKSLNTEVCEACGRLFVRKKTDSQFCLCKRCRKELEEDARRSQRKKVSYNTCRICRKKFLPSWENPDQDVCEECLELTIQTQMKCACQKVTFSEPLEEVSCRCDSPGNTRNRRPKKNIEKKLYEDATEFCPVCERELSLCLCGPKFFPKKPKLIGKEGRGEHGKKFISLMTFIIRPFGYVFSKRFPLLSLYKCTSQYAQKD